MREPGRRPIPIPAVHPPKKHPYDQWAPDTRALDIIGDKWTLLIVRDLVCGPRRFVELQRVLPGISTEQLRSRLNRMVADGLLTRQRYREVPPRVDYELTPRARELAPIIAEISRWGYSWAWGAPRTREAVDISAIFRATIALAHPARGLKGTIELTVDERPYSMTIESGAVTLAETAATNPVATVSGSCEAWIAALGPRRSRDGLEFGGDRAQADSLLDAVALSNGRRVPATA